MYGLSSSMKRLRRDVSPEGHEVGRNVQTSLSKRPRPLCFKPSEMSCPADTPMLTPFSRTSSINKSKCGAGSPIDTLLHKPPNMSALEATSQSAYTDNEGDVSMGDSSMNKNVDNGGAVNLTPPLTPAAPSNRSIPHITINQDIHMDSQKRDAPGATSQVDPSSTSPNMPPSGSGTASRVSSFSIPHRGLTFRPISSSHSPGGTKALGAGVGPPAEASHPAPQPLKRRIAMGYRNDCEKCRNRVPGHYNHIITVR